MSKEVIQTEEEKSFECEWSNVFENVDRFTNKDDLDDYIKMPVCSREEVEEVENFFDKMKPSEQKQLSEEDTLAAVSYIVTNKVSALPRVSFEKTIVDGKLCNKIIDPETETDLSCRPLHVKTKGLSGELKGDVALAVLASSMGLNENIRIKLYHSGFSVVLGRIENAEIISLITKLTVRKTELGKNTHGLVFSNETIIFSKIIVDFLYEHAISSTLKVDDFRPYIVFADIFVIFTSIMQGIFPKGIEIVRNCSNAILDKETKKLKCNFILKALVKPTNMINVDMRRFSKFHRDTLAVEDKDSLTPDIIDSYQKTLRENQIEEYVIDSPDGESKFIFGLQFPTYVKAVEIGEDWLRQIENEKDELLAEEDSDGDEIEIKKYDELTKVSLLNRYRYFIKYISISSEDNKVVVEDDETIKKYLDFFMNDERYYNAIMGFYETFIDKNTLPIIGLPDYKCPDCQKTQETHSHESYKSIVPVNPYWSFFETCTLKYRKIEKIVSERRLQKN